MTILEKNVNGQDNETDRAIEWLKEFLADEKKMSGLFIRQGDSKFAAPINGSVIYESEQAGFAWYRICRAQKKLGIIPFHDTKEDIWYWALPRDEDNLIDRLNAELLECSENENWFM